MPANTDTVIDLDTTLNDHNPLIAGYGPRFERFRINRIKWTVIPNFNVGVAGTSEGGYVYTVGDPYGPTTARTVDECRNCSTAKRKSFWKPFSIYIKPTVETPIFTTTTGPTMHRRQPAPWVRYADPSSGDVTHYGAQFLVSHAQAFPTAGVSFDILETIYVSFKDKTGH